MKYSEAQQDWKPGTTEFLLHKSELSFRLEGGFIIIEDQTEIKRHVDVIEFMNHMVITNQPYFNRTIEDFIVLTPSWKIINLVIEFDNLKNK